SAATLVAPSSSTPTFVADIAGTYVVQLIVNDGFTNSNTTTVVITAADTTTITFTPNPLKLGLNSTGTLTLKLPNPAGPNGQLVNLSSLDSTVASVPSTITVPFN